MFYDYDTYVTQFSDKFIPIRIDPTYVQKINDFAHQVITEKLKEQQHKFDGSQELKRFTTGLLGEAAVEQILGIPIIDWTVGASTLYNHPDIPGYKVGVKTVERNKFPIIYKNNEYPQIICIKNLQYSNGVFVCGLATPEVLNTYQDIDLILSPALKAKGFKTGFYGFQFLQPVNSIEDIKEYKHNEN